MGELQVKKAREGQLKDIEAEENRPKSRGREVRLGIKGQNDTKGLLMVEKMWCGD